MFLMSRYEDLRAWEEVRGMEGNRVLRSNRNLTNPFPVEMAASVRNSETLISRCV